MGWKGTARSFGAAYRRGVREYEREERLRQKELERRHKEAVKMEMLAQAAYDVECFENLIDRLTTVHREPVEQVNWSEVADIAPPLKPTKDSENEEKAQKAIENYKPGFWDKLFKKVEKKEKWLQDRLLYAKEKDGQSNKQLLEEYNREYADWESETHLARQVLARDLTSFRRVLRESTVFEELNEFGSIRKIEFKDESTAIVVYSVVGKEIIPSEKKTLTQTGKLSKKNMPKGEFFENFQDHVCSSAIRIANELMSLLPLESVYVTVNDKMLNTATGHLEEASILSVKIPKETLKQLNLESIDASDSMSNFVHEMKFRKTKGFEAVNELQAV